MRWFHSFLLVIGLVLLVSVQHSDGTAVESGADSPDPQTNLGLCSCCKNEEIWKSVAYMKTLITWLRSKMADAGNEAVHYQKLDYLKSFEYKFLVFKSKYDPEPEPEIDWPW
ncbi:hypothetical protein LOTGIDRAFT_165125 [Lottia gigantea]|uniref:Uncharacterized protein n=1 Tax=Lottia gigantea TaxID=225164 RepID=V4BLI2_LOTGI|nr:hypothetical protein LOTGIDRAFT_165125 [Lottia gigantea]ESO89534.1 hypothetical protein LOTGIDRAFT_165125 [Lottia gigantea]